MALALAAAGTGAAGTAASLVVTGAPAGAEPIGDCATTSGVVVVVDFAHWGGTVERGCAADPSAGSTTGLQAMHTAGFTTVGVSEYGTAFVCRITDPATGVAEPPTTPCTKTPPASAYWSYWHADAGQTTWSYSQLGVVTYKPPPGSVTAWVFGGTNVTGSSGTGKPPFTPTQVRATNITPAGGGATTTTTTAAPVTTTTTTTATPSGPSAGGGIGSTAPAAGGPSPRSGGTGGLVGSGGSGGAVTTTTGGQGSGSTTTPSTATSGAGSGSTTTTSGAKGGGAASTGPGGRSGGGKGVGSHGSRRAGASPRIVDVDPAPARHASSSGSPLPLVLGIVLVAALAGAAGAIAWRRRRAGQAGGA